MKKKYNQPTLEVVNIQTEGMIANSMVISDKKGDQQLSNKKNHMGSPIWD